MSAEIHDLHRARSGQAVAPQNLEAEQALLGATLINNEAFASISGFLKPEHFSEELHRRIFDVASQLISAGRLATPIRLKTFFGDADLGGITVSQYLARLAAEATAVANAGDYGRTVYELATRRELVDIGERLARVARDQAVDASCSDVASDGIDELQRIADRAVAANTRRDPAECGQILVDKARNHARRAP